MEEKKTISLSVTLEEYRLIKIAAESKGMKPSGYCKMAAFTYLSKSPPRGGPCRISPSAYRIQIVVDCIPLLKGIYTASIYTLCLQGVFYMSVIKVGPHGRMNPGADKGCNVSLI